MRVHASSAQAGLIKYTCSFSTELASAHMKKGIKRTKSLKMRLLRPEMRTKRGFTRLAHSLVL